MSDGEEMENRRESEKRTEMFLTTHAEKRRSQRVEYKVDAESFFGTKRYRGVIENFSMEGLLKVIPSGQLMGCSPGMALGVNFQTSSGKSFNLICEIKWLRVDSNMPFGVRHAVGMEIIEPPPEYTEFVEHLYSQYPDAG